MSFFDELKRRNVLRVGAAYVVSAWLVIQVVDTIFPAFGFSQAAVRIVTILCVIGLVPTLIFAWALGAALGPALGAALGAALEAALTAALGAAGAALDVGAIIGGPDDSQLCDEGSPRAA